MKIYKIAVWGDNQRLHEEALAAATAAVEATNHAPVQRAWMDTVDEAASEAWQAYQTAWIAGYHAALKDRLPHGTAKLLVMAAEDFRKEHDGA